MHTRVASLLAFALLTAATTVGISTDAHGGGQVEFTGEVCMPADKAVRFISYDAIPVWWGEEEEIFGGQIPPELVEDCLENGTLVIDGDVVDWVENPTLDECLDALQDWWDDGSISGACRDMGHQKYWSCMATMESSDPEGLWMDHENLCDRAGEACAFACQQGHPQISC